jgi:hypothetical protein
MDRFLISYRLILCHHAPGDWPVAGGRRAAMETTAAFARFDEKVSHGGSQ